MYEAAARGDSRLVAAMARHEAAKIEAGRAWIDTVPDLDACQTAA